jgi:hypothetical protein
VFETGGLVPAPGRRAELRAVLPHDPRPASAECRRHLALAALPTWAHWSIFAAAVLLSPVLPFVMAGMLMNVVAVLKYADPPAFLVLVAVSTVAWSLLGRFGRASSNPYFGTEKRRRVPAGEGARLSTVREAYPGPSLRDGRGWAHMRLVDFDFGQPVGRYTDPEQRVRPDRSEQDSQRTSTLETPRRGDQRRIPYAARPRPNRCAKSRSTKGIG